MSYRKTVTVRSQGSVHIEVEKAGVRVTVLAGPGHAELVLQAEHVDGLVEALDTARCYFAQSSASGK